MLEPNGENVLRFFDREDPIKCPNFYLFIHVLVIMVFYYLLKFNNEYHETYFYLLLF